MNINSIHLCSNNIKYLDITFHFVWLKDSVKIKSKQWFCNPYGIHTTQTRMLKKLSQSVRGCTRIVLSYKQLKNKNVHSAYLLRVNGGGVNMQKKSLTFTSILILSNLYPCFLIRKTKMKKTGTLARLKIMERDRLTGNQCWREILSEDQCWGDRLTED